MEFRLLGPLEVVEHGLPVEVGTAKVKALLTNLLLHANAVVSADRLVEDLWGQSPPATAAGTLQTYVAKLRRVLEPGSCAGEQERVLTRRPGYLLRVDPGELDVVRFEELLVQGHEALSQAQWQCAARTLREALALWRGPALTEFASEPFAQAEAVRLEEARISALEDRIAADFALGAHTHLVAELQALVGEHPLREKLRGQLMVALHRSGRQAEALRAYEAFRRLLGEELGLEPTLELKRLEDALLRQKAEPDWPGAPPTISPRGGRGPVSVGTVDRRRHTVPLQRTKYVGTEQIRSAQKLLQTTRLLTLTGMGGIGKTRLALEVATAGSDDFAGVTVVELAPVVDPSSVAEQVLSALGATETAGESVKRALVNWVGSRHLLIVLDNCEHLVESIARFVDDLLNACPNVRILATSRERLRVPGETVMQVPPLLVPPSGGMPALEALVGYDSVRLFLDRAVSVAPELELSEKNGAAVAQICRSLDGIPLALELAAARIPAVSLTELAKRLNDRFRLLTRGSRAASARHQTLRAVVDWTYEALPEIERRVFNRTSVFAGTFDLDAVETVVVGEGVAKADVFDSLANLVDKSLIVHDESAGKSRYRLLEILRQYAAEKLTATGEEVMMRTRHLQWALSVAERTNAERPSAGDEAWSAEFAVEHDNFRAALAWVVSTGQGNDALRLAEALTDFWFLRGLYSEARKWLEASLEVAPSASAALRAKALHAAGGFALSQGDYPAAHALENKSLDLCEELGNLAGKADALRRLSALALRQDHYAAAEAFGAASFDIARTLDDKAMTAAALTNLSEAARGQGDFLRGRRLGEEGLCLRRELGDDLGCGFTLVMLAHIAAEVGDYDDVEVLCAEAEAIAARLGATVLLGGALWARGMRASFTGDLNAARRLLEQVLAMDEESGNRHDVAWNRQLLADVATAEGDLKCARSAYEDVLGVARLLNDRRMGAWSLRGLARVACREANDRAAASLCLRALLTSDEIGDKPGIAEALELLAGIAVRDGDGPRAARLLGAAETLRIECSNPVHPWRREEYEETVAAASLAAGPSRFRLAMAEGRGMGRGERMATAAEQVAGGSPLTESRWAIVGAT